MCRAHMTRSRQAQKDSMRYYAYPYCLIMRLVRLALNKCAMVRGHPASQRVVDVVVMVDRAFEVTFVSLGLHDYPVRYVPVSGGIDAFAAY